MSTGPTVLCQTTKAIWFKAIFIGSPETYEERDMLAYPAFRSSLASFDREYMDTNCYEASPLASQDLPRNNSGAYSAKLSKVEKISSVDGFDGVGEVVVMMVHSAASVSPSGAAMPPWWDP